MAGRVTNVFLFCFFNEMDNKYAQMYEELHILPNDHK